MTRDEPTMNAFQLVRIPPIPPSTKMVPAHCPPHKAVAASAVAMLDSARFGVGNPNPTEADIKMYQSTAQATEMTNPSLTGYFKT